MSPTEIELELLEDLQSLKHEKLSEVSLMDLATRHMLEKYGPKRSIAIELDAETLTATFYEVSEKEGGGRFNLRKHAGLNATPQIRKF
ncbi:hypothetical protein ACFLQU_00995 [Verrucomicrobiota bacterium]